MTISFNEVPSNIQEPLFYAEFDNSKASTAGSSALEVLMIGQKLSAGTVEKLVPTIVTNKETAISAFGAGSMLARMAEKYLDNNSFNKLVCVALDDNDAGVAATGSFTLAGTATKAGVVNFYIGDRKYQVAVSSSDSASDIAAALNTKINADEYRTVDSVVDGSVSEKLNFTARNKGEVSNSIALEANYNDGEVYPDGISGTIVALNSGAANPAIDDVFTVIGEDQYTLISCPYLDTTNLVSLEAELASRFGPIRQNDGYAIFAKKDTLSNLSTLGDSKNSQFTTIMGYQGGLNDEAEWSAAIVGKVTAAAQNDPAQPFQTLTLTGITAPKTVDLFNISEKNLLLLDGIATFNVSPNNDVLIGRLVTTFKENSFGSPDNSYMDLNSPLTLSLLRQEVKSKIESKYERHKLGNDGQNFGAGQKIVTPRVFKSELVTLAIDWVRRGLIEDIDAFKEGLIVERNTANRNRLDVVLPPNLVNQLRIVGMQIQFLL